MGNFYTDVIQPDVRFNNTGRVNDVQLLEPVMQSAVAAIIAEAGTLSIALMPYETYRSQARQAILYEQGVSKLEHVGVHHYGLACDLVKVINGEPSWKGDFTFLGHLARTHGLVWGGDWGQPTVRHTFIDAVHVQRITVADQSRLFNGSWYPDDAYDPYEVRQQAEVG